MELFFDVVIYFILFSFCGWVCETVYCSVAEKRFVYRGFLNGPICPVYGFGGLIVVYLLAPFQDSIVLLFIFGMISTTILEYVTHFLLEKLFHKKWWDYSKRPFNINGRVCLPYSIMFGLLSIVAVEILYPPFRNFVEVIIPYKAKPYIASILLAILMLDLAATVTALLRANGKIKELEAKMSEFRAKAEQLYEQRTPLIQQWEEFKAAYEAREKSGFRKFIDSLSQKVESRINHSYPNLKSTRDKSLKESFKLWLAEHKDEKDEDKTKTDISERE